MGNISNVIWNGIYHTEDQIKDEAENIINNNSSLKSAEDTVQPYWQELIDNKK